MMDPSALLGGLLQGGMRGPSSARVDHAMGERGLGGQGGPFAGMMGQLGGGGQQGGFGSSGGGGGGLGGLLGGLTGMLGGSSGRGTGGGGGMGGLGSLAGMLGGGRGGMGGGGMGGGGMGGGGMGMLAMLAVQALRSSGQGQSAGVPGTMPGQPGGQDDDPRRAIPDEAMSDQATELVLKAMINAAKADGQIDETERRQIMSKAGENGAGQAEIDYLEQQLAAPMDHAALTPAAGNKVLGAQVYAASLLAINADTPAEREYLRDLAQRLGLEPATVAELHQHLNVPA